MILDEIISSKKKELKSTKYKKPIGNIIKELNKSSKSDSRNFKEALVKEDISIIGEIKKASPSKGVIVKNFYPKEIAKIYEKLNIDAVSVLTEKNYFKGKDSYITLTKNIISKPVLRKDFIIDEYQIYESKLLGADAILLIVGILGNSLNKFYNLSYDLGLQCIVEVHNRKELDIALNINPEIIGINNRNLDNFTIDIGTTENLIKLIPNNTVVISESGIKDESDFNYIKDLPIDAVLIGEGFMRRINDIYNMNVFISDLKKRNQR